MRLPRPLRLKRRALIDTQSCFSLILEPNVKLYRVKGTTLDSLIPSEEPSPIPGAHEVLVRVRAVSLNYKDLNFLKPGAPPPGGLVPLSDAAGEIVSVGPGVTRLKLGDRVANVAVKGWIDGPPPADAYARSFGAGIDGVLSEFRVVNEQDLLRLPSGYDWIEGSTLPIAALSAWNSLAELQPKQTVLILGTGGVAIFALQFAKARGARVIMTSSSDWKIAKIREYGADETVNRGRHPDWETEVLSLTDGRGVDLVVEAVGGSSVQRSIAAAAIGGTVNVVGNGKGPIEAYSILARAVRVRGIRIGPRNMFEDMIAFIDQKRIRPVVHRVFSFAEARSAYEHLIAANHLGKIVISIESK